jgi:hypothetical protein
MQKHIASWNKRNLSILGKIQIVKTFLLSQFVFVMQSVGIPQETLTIINRIIYKFLWKKTVSNKKAFEKVKRSVLCKGFSEGGLEMIDIVDMQNSFLLMWVTKLNNANNSVWTSIPRHWYKSLGRNLSVLESSVACRDFIGLNYIKSIFWKRVLSTWLVHNKSGLASIEDMDLEKISTQVLWNNEVIRYKKSPLMIRECIRADIIRVGDILKENRIMTFEEYMCKTGTSTNSIFDYNAIVNSIPQVWIDKLTQRTLMVITVDNTNIRFREVPVQACTCQLYRRYLVEDKTSSVCAVKFWQHKFDMYLTNLHWQVAIDCTREVRLRTLHWKILHNIYPTNILLHKMGLRPSRPPSKPLDVCKTLRKRLF